MNELQHTEVPDSSAGSFPDVDLLLASLRSAGAHRFDPVRWRYIEVLSERMGAHQGSTKRMLGTRLTQALVAYKERYDLARCEAETQLARSVQEHPQSTNDLQRLFAASDFNGLRRLVAMLKARKQCAALSDLVVRLERHSQGSLAARSGQNAGSPPELKTIRNFRSTWSKLSVDKQVAQALEQAPKNAGPINSHMLVLRSLALMREVSPDYLNRFMSYADTLLCLGQGEKEKMGLPKKVQAPKTKKK